LFICDYYGYRLPLLITEESKGPVLSYLANGYATGKHTEPNTEIIYEYRSRKPKFGSGSTDDDLVCNKPNNIFCYTLP
jgi:hypothetical protein